jgi:hypothetical protein
VPHQRHPEHQRLLHQLLEPTIGAEACGTEAKVKEPAGLAVDQRLDAELLSEAFQLPGRCGALQKVYEVGLDPPLGEKTERLSGAGTLLYAEDLDFHGAGI